VLNQLHGDRRTVALLLLMPSVLVGLFAWLFSSGQTFQRLGPMLLALFPFTLMFIVTAISTLRERTGGTLDRMMTTPITKADVIGGYALAFSVMAAAQTLITVGFAVWVCGLDVAGSMWLLIAQAVVNSIVGTSLGLFTSAFARTEFQAVQFLPVFVFPQIILGGIFMPRAAMPHVLRVVSDCFPLSYAVEGVQNAARGLTGWDIGRPLLIMAAFAVGCLALGALTLRRRSD
jgi:ABC transporter DrrB family efflux protein